MGTIGEAGRGPSHPRGKKKTKFITVNIQEKRSRYGRPLTMPPPPIFSSRYHPARHKHQAPLRKNECGSIDIRAPGRKPAQSLSCNETGRERGKEKRETQEEEESLERQRDYRKVVRRESRTKSQRTRERSKNAYLKCYNQVNCGKIESITRSSIERNLSKAQPAAEAILFCNSHPATPISISRCETRGGLMDRIRTFFSGHRSVKDPEPWNKKRRLWRLYLQSDGSAM